MFIKRGDGVITGVIKTSEELTDSQKEKVDELAQKLSNEDNKSKLDNKDN